jgi:hypothetical protein
MTSSTNRPTNLAELKASGWKSRSVKEEIRPISRTCWPAVANFFRVSWAMKTPSSRKSVWHYWQATTFCFWVKKGKAKAA